MRQATYILLKRRSSWVRGFSWGCRGELFQNTPIPLVLH
ncbi:hypothetical protein HPHPA16_0225 [Helicobacter pylori Hp A-16]|nr:hypothetical protein HPHPA16_0225 [Helicobacter pylori Hp A-16]